MAKLTKAQAKAHKEACEILEQDTLTEDEKEFVFRNWQESANHVNSSAGAFFTPFEMAFDFALDVWGDTVVDLCAGIGMLSYAVWCRSQWDEKRPQLTCVEINPDYVAVGKKLMPEANWICMNALDYIEEMAFHDMAISNPPFGNISRNGKNGPRYTGKDFEFHIIDVAAHISRRGAFIVPQMSAGFNYSGRQFYERQNEGKAVEFQKKTGIRFDAGAGVDTSYYQDAWKGVSPLCEIVVVEFEGEE